MNFIKSKGPLIILLIIYLILENNFPKLFSQKWFRVTLIALGIVGLVFCEIFKIGMKIDNFFIIIITYSAIELFNMLKGHSKQNNKSIAK